MNENKIDKVELIKVDMTDESLIAMAAISGSELTRVQANRDVLRAKLYEKYVRDLKALNELREKRSK